MSDEPTNPTEASEARIESVIMTTATGDRVLRDRYCEICQPAMAGGTKMVPYHDASDRCQSGKRTHCSCDTCF